jgi:hypothetical protein
VIAAWVLYATAVAALCVGAAHAAERALHLAGRPTRWAWAAAMLLSCLGPPAAFARVRVAPPAGATEASPTPSPPPGVEGAAGGSRVVAVVRRAVLPAAWTARDLRALDRPLAGLWLLASGAWALVLAGSAVRVRRRAAAWAPVLVDGVPVRVSHADGPALVGLMAPEIVLPRWALELPAAQRQLIVTHERQHARARDPLLLAAAAAMLVAVPWNAALWYAYGRLRLAVEVDCDARVLHGRRAGRPDVPADGQPDVHAVRAYGSLLLDVSERMIVGAAPVTGLAGPTSHLDRRLTMMTARVPRFARIRLAAAVAASAACAVLAAQTPAPAAGVRPGPTRGDPRDGSVPIAASDSTRRDSVPAFIADTTVRRGVAERFPDALRGGMGRRPFLWILADAQDRVLGTATGRQGLSRNKFGQEGLDWEAARRKFPEQLPPAMTRDDRAQWNAVAIAGADTAQVIWIRVARPVAPR